MPILFCHGLESGPHGRKYAALTAAGLAIESPDFRGQDLARRVESLRAILAERPDPLMLIGSSYGGITALLVAIQLAEVGRPVGGLLLCAPALARQEPPATTTELRAPAPTAIIHGRDDEVIPIAVSRSFAATTGARLIEVDDNHSLAKPLDVIIAEARAMAETIGT